MRVLVLGGKRYMGKRAVAQLLADGAQVTLLSRGIDANPFGSAVQEIRVDRCDEARVAALVSGHHWDAVLDQSCYEVKAAEVAAKHLLPRTDHYVFASSVVVYEDGLGLQESDFSPATWNPAACPSPPGYADMKRISESRLMRSAPEKVTFLRFPIVLGEDDYTGRLESHIAAILKGRPLAVKNPKILVSFVRSEDAANASVFALRQAVPRGPLNIASRDPISLADLYELIFAAVQKYPGKGALGSDSPEKEGGELQSASSSFDWEADRTMEVKKALALGFQLEPMKNWLPPLVQLLTERLIRQEGSGSNWAR